jgi:hypothetical protein
MASKTIEILISPAGDIVINAIGFKGADCEKATRFLEQALGVCVKRRRKPESLQKGLKQVRQDISS